MPIPTFDFAIIGGGLFGCYAALFLAGKGRKVILIEKEKELLRKASMVNQARLHSGYHYPRSVATALMSDDHKKRFTIEHREFVHSSFDQFYAIDRNTSFTDSIQFERFCDHIGLPYKRIDQHPHFDLRQMEALYLTEEQTFDPILMANYYRRRLADQELIRVACSHSVTQAEAGNNSWKLSLGKQTDGASTTIRAEQVINATYSASNAIHQVFGLAELELMHEISEIALVTSPQVKETGLTIMDGPFASLMPYGHSGLLSLSSVAYTHHKTSFKALPAFDCQPFHPHCRPHFTANCTDCHLQPPSNYRKMISQIKLFFKPDIQFNYFQSLYTIKSKLKASYIDDGRPTEISVMQEYPRFYCIFAGKINSIYEIEKIIDLG